MTLDENYTLNEVKLKCVCVFIRAHGTLMASSSAGSLACVSEAGLIVGQGLIGKTSASSLSLPSRKNTSWSLPGLTLLCRKIAAYLETEHDSLATRPVFRI